MTNPETPRHIEIKDEDNRVVAEAVGDDGPRPGGHRPDVDAREE